MTTNNRDNIKKYHKPNYVHSHLIHALFAELLFILSIIPGLSLHMSAAICSDLSLRHVFKYACIHYSGRFIVEKKAQATTGWVSCACTVILNTTTP